MKRIWLIVILLLLTACSSRPSESAIQTAIAQTETAQSTPESVLEIVEEALNTAVAQTQIAPTNTIKTIYPPTEIVPPAQESGIPTILWSIDNVSYLYPYPNLIVGNNIIVNRGNQKLEARDLFTGQVHWEYLDPGYFLGSDDKYIFILPSSKRIDALDAVTGESKWSALLQEEFGGKLIVTDKYLFAPIGNGNYYAMLDKFTGQIINYFVFYSLKIDGGIIVANGNIGIDPETMQPIWDLSQIPSEEIEVCDKITVYESDGTIQAIDTLSGKLIWLVIPPFNEGKIRIDYYPPCYVANPSTYEELMIAHGLDITSNNIYGILNDTDSLIAINDNNGEVRWIGKPVSDYSWLGELGKKVFYSHEGYRITQAFDAQDHQQLWENNSTAIDRIIGVHNNVLIGSDTNDDHDQYLVSLDLSTGMEEWRTEPQPLRIFQDNFGQFSLIFNRLYDRSVVAQLQVRNPETGELITSLVLQSSIKYMLPYEDYLIVFQDDGYLSVVR